MENDTDNSGFEEYGDEENSGADRRIPLKGITLLAVGSPNTKRRGDASEAAFISRACGFDLRVAKPWGDNDSYDVLVGFGHGFWRVQVKSAASCWRGSYGVPAGGTRGLYTKNEIDFIAAQIVPDDVWYIVPVEAFAGRSRLNLYPRGWHRGKYEKYREAWCLLGCSETARGWEDVPVVCRCRELPVRCAVCPLK